MVKRGTDLKIWFLMYIVVITAWLLGSAMQAGAQIQKTMADPNNFAVDRLAVEEEDAENETIGSEEALDFAEEGGVPTPADVNAVGKTNSITIRASASPKAGGTISPSGTVAVEYGADLQFTIKPNKGYQIKDVVVDGVPQGGLNKYTFTAVTKKHSIQAKFTKQTFTVTITEGEKVSVSPVGTKTATYGKKMNIKIKPDTADIIPILLVDGQQVETTKSGNAYQFVVTVFGDTSIYATSHVEPLIPDNTKVDDDSAAQNLSSVSEDQSVLTFDQNTPYAKSLQPGDVIVSGVTDATPDGLLRKVTNVSTGGSEITVETSEATLEDAIEDGESNLDQPLTANDIESFVPLIEGVTLRRPEAGALSDQGAVQAIQACLDLNGVLYDHDGNSNTKGDQIRISGEACLSPIFRFGIGISWFRLRHVVFSTGVSESISLQLDAQYSASFSKEIQIAKIRFKPVKVQVGYVPLVFVPVLTVYVGIEGEVSAGITTRVTQSAEFIVGVAYHRGQGWAPIKTLSADFDYELPKVSMGAGVKVYAGPEFGFYLYGMAGPYANIEGYLDLQLDPLSNPWLSLYGGIDVGVGVKARAFGKTLFDYGIDPLIEYRELIAQVGGNQPPAIVSLTANPTTVETGKTSTITVAAKDPENDPLTCSWSASGGTLSATSGCGSVTWTAPLTAGNYTVSVSVSDNKGSHDPVTDAVTIGVSPPDYTLTVNKSGIGTGTVTGTGINCGEDCSENYASGTSVTLTATPSLGSALASWSGCDNTSGNTCTVTMNQNKAVTATFTTSNYTLTVNKSGTCGTVTGTGINCGEDCSENYASGTSVTLTANILPGCTLTSWSGCDSTGVSTCTVTMNQSRTITATFNMVVPPKTLTVNKSGTCSGTVTGMGINCGSDCSEDYVSGTSVTLTATGLPGCGFTSWSDCDTTSSNTCTITMNQSRTITATFNMVLPPTNYTLTVVLPGTGNSMGRVTGTGIYCGLGGSDCSENYASGTSVILTATPTENIYKFASWSGCDSTSSNTCMVTMNQSKTVTATFDYNW